MFKPLAHLSTDSYKLGHMIQYPQGTEFVSSNFTPRSNHHSPIPKEWDDGMVVVFGTQAVIQQMNTLWKETFFDRPLDTVINEIKEFVAPFAGNFEVGIKNFTALHNLGYLPLEIKAIDEGTVVPIKTPVFIINNTIPEFYWLVNYVETYLSQESWKMMTVATIARAYRRILEHYANITNGDINFVDWQAHDFSARGLSGSMDNAMVGAAHLTQFTGTDSLLGVQYVNHFYNGSETFIGGSVPATEHSIMSMGGELNELETFRHLIEDVYPSGIVSIVSDTWDFWQVLTDYAVQLKDKILNRIPNELGLAKVVFRPDSGDPVDILTGTAIYINGLSESIYSNYDIEEALRNYYKVNDISGNVVATNNGKYYHISTYHGYRGNWLHKVTQIYYPTPEMKGAVEVLYETFGGTITSEGFKQLHERVGLIYGDSITLKRANQICERLMQKGFASTNIVFGVGSYSYQMLTRDTFGFAMKATYGIVNGEPRNIIKNPKTDSGMKKSLTGLIRVVEEDGEIVTYDNQPDTENSLLTTLFKDGKFEKSTTITKIRNKLKNSHD